MSRIVRRMVPGDIDGVYRIETLSFRIPWSRASFERDLSENPCARYLVAEEDGFLCAYAGMWLVLDEAHITNIAVHPDRRRQGYGELITSSLIRYAADLCMSFLTLEVRRSNAAAQALYHKLGFVDVGFRRRYYEDNQEDALIMVREHLPEPRRDCPWEESVSADDER